MFISLTFFFYSILIISSIIFILYLKREILFKYQKYLTKKTILLTGGSLGVGRELLHLLISKFNCQVINLDIRENEFDAIKSEYKDKVINIACNVAKVDDMVQFLSEKNINPDNIDIVINNAAIANNLSIKNLSKEKMIRTIDINLLAPMKIIKSFIDNKISKKQLSNKSLHFVTLCSCLSHIASSNSCDYICSKWGLYGFIECVRSEFLYDKSYIFTTICPYAINTGMFGKFFMSLGVKDVSKDIIKSIALKETVKFLPTFLYVPIFLYKFVPTFIGDFLQKNIVNQLTSNITGRKENDTLFKSKKNQ